MGEGEGQKDAGGEEIEPPGDLHGAKARALGQHDVKRDQKDIGHGEAAEKAQGRQGAGREQAKVEKGKPVPLCCTKEMEPLAFCTTAPHPEMARNYDEDLPCDDGTAAKKK